MIEFAVIAPVLMSMMTGIIDMGYMFAVQHNMMSVSQEAARLVAVGELTTGNGESYVRDRLMLPRSSYGVDVDEVGGNVVVDIDAPFSKVVLVDILGIFKTGNLSAHSRMRIL